MSEEYREPVEVPQEVLTNFNTKQRVKKWGEVKKFREQKRTADLLYNGLTFQMDDLSRENLKDQLEEGVTVQWRLIDNSVTHITPTDVSYILKEYRERKQLLYVKSWEVEEAINASDDAINLDVMSMYEEALSI